MTVIPSPTPPPPPTGRTALRYDFLAGFLVFLIAMPLCLAIARASGFPPIAGIWTAVLGGLICSRISNSQLTIKGPAAGLIVIVLGAVTELGNEFGAGLSDLEKAYVGYRLALGIGVTAGVIQILFGLLRLGRLADCFPLTPVHGMLASIGLIIIARQSYEVFGITATKGAGPLTLFAELPQALTRYNPEIACIGVVSLLILFVLPWIKWSALKRVPAQLIVLLVAMALGIAFDLEHKHTYLFPDRFFDLNHQAEYEVGPRFLVDMPEVLQNPMQAFVLPDFRGLATFTGLQYVLLFALIGSLESLLSAKAIELVDPWHRKTNFDRDLLAVGIANTVAATIGALPMISEIVRSKANIDSSAHTRNANLFHGLFLLGFVLLFPNLIHQIPLAALGAMLVYTGFRLANPKEFVRTYRIGSEQFIVFVGTIIATLATDLLLGIGIGIALKVGFHLWHGCPLCGFIKPVVAECPSNNLMILTVQRAAVFMGWPRLQAALVRAAEGRDAIVLDLSATRFVDHTVMEKLHQLQCDFGRLGKHLTVVGLEQHQPLSAHPLSARVVRS